VAGAGTVGVTVVPSGRVMVSVDDDGLVRLPEASRTSTAI
jgi:hypothetical protein